MHALEKEIATHSSILPWGIPRTEEPGELQSTGSQRVRLSDQTTIDGNWRLEGKGGRMVPSRGKIVC